jgi:uncharacterized protein YydD (DUF2326 family)
MKLLQLTSQNSKFKDITFKDGLNIIVGEKTDRDRKETSNGVGKTLSIRLIDYMLAGRNQKIDKILEDLDTPLTLQFSVGETTHQVYRDGKVIALDEKECRLKDLKAFFDAHNTLDEFSFRDVLVRFVRKAYNHPTEQLEQEESFKNNAINARLLGLDTSYVEKKRELYYKRKTLTEIIKYLKELKSDVDKEAVIETREELASIEKAIETFQIAENYHELKEKADELSRKIAKIENEIRILERRKKQQEEIIRVNKQEDIDVDMIERIYAEAEFFLKEEVIRHLDAVKNFHETLFENRKKRAREEIETIEKKKALKEKEMSILDKERADLLKLLDNKGALDEYNALLKRREELVEKLQILEAKEKEKERYEEEKQRLKLEIDAFELELIELEKRLKKRFDELTGMFRDISSLFYERPGYLNIDINKNMQAKHLYKIEPKIQADDSSGISMMKIFIYDMLIYGLNKDVVGFVAHDNLLFDVVDERQVATAMDYAKNNTAQYICSISDSKINGAKEYADTDFKDEIVLHLGEHDKLFGRDF